MLDFNIKENAPALLLVLATVILAITFILPVGGERRRSQTRYQNLSGFVTAFEVRQDSAPALSAPIAATEKLKITQSALAEAALNGTGKTRRKRGHVKSAPDSKIAPSHPWPHLVSAQTPAPILASADKSSVTISTAPTAEKAELADVPAKPASETADFVAESYENDPAKYPMDRSAAQGPIALSLCGLSHQKSRYILKVTATNNGGDDFFVKELSVRDGRTTLASKSFFRLFVEPGRTREGFVVFDAPRTGADIHVALKEDREKGRVVELPVPYSF